MRLCSDLRAGEALLHRRWITTTGATRCGWPAAASEAASVTEPPTSWVIGVVHKQWVSPAGRPIHAVALSPDETLAVTGTQNGHVQVVRVPTGQIVAELKPHRDAVEFIVFRPDGQMLATGSKDNTVRLWGRHADSFSELITLSAPVSAPGPVTWLSFTPDGTSLAMLIQDEYAVRFWRLDRLQQRLGELGLGW